MRLPVLYHWAPTERRAAVRAEGLRLYSAPVVHNGTERAPYLCLSPEPDAGWSLSGAMEWCDEIEQWDLWLVRLQDGDEVHIRPDFGPKIAEVRVYTPIPADRLWWVGERRHPCFEDG